MWQNGSKVPYNIFTLQVCLWEKEKVNKTEILGRSKHHSLGIKLGLKSISQVSMWHGAGASSCGAPCCRADGWGLLPAQPTPTHTGLFQELLSVTQTLSIDSPEEKKKTFEEGGKKMKKKKGLLRMTWSWAQLGHRFCSIKPYTWELCVFTWSLCFSACNHFAVIQLSLLPCCGAAMWVHLFSSQ